MAKQDFPFYIIVEIKPEPSVSSPVPFTAVNIFTDKDEAQDCFVNSPFEAVMYGTESINGFVLVADVDNQYSLQASNSECVWIDSKIEG